MKAHLIVLIATCWCWNTTSASGADAVPSESMALLEIQGEPRARPDLNPEHSAPDDDAQTHLVVVDLASGKESSRHDVGRFVSVLGVDPGRQIWLSRLHPDRGTEFLTCDTRSTNAPRMLGAVRFYVANSKNRRGMVLDRPYACLLDDTRVAGVFFDGKKEQAGLPDCPQKLVIAAPSRGEIEFESELTGEFRFARIVRLSASRVVLVGLEGGLLEFRRDPDRWWRRGAGKLRMSESLGAGSLADVVGLRGGNILALSPRGVASLRDPFMPFPCLPLPEGARALGFDLASDGTGSQAVATFSSVREREVTSDVYFVRSGRLVPAMEVAGEIHALAVIDRNRALFSQWGSVFLATYAQRRTVSPVYEGHGRRIGAIRHLPASAHAGRR